MKIIIRSDPLTALCIKGTRFYISGSIRKRNLPKALTRQVSLVRPPVQVFPPLIYNIYILRPTLFYTFYEEKK